jgi:futalosine hydrolase
MAEGFPHVDILVTGPGMVATAHHVSRVLHQRIYDLVINAGIAGSFRSDLPISSVVRVDRDGFPELGADHPRGFIPMYSMDMARAYRPAGMSENGELDAAVLKESAALQSLRGVTGITVNTISGHADRIVELQKRTNADVESMEGAAVFHTCHLAHVPCIQIRSVSNYIHPDHLDHWEIRPAVDTLNATLKTILHEI